MINISESIVIKKPLAELFAFSLDQHNLPKWQKSVIKVDAPAGPVTKGYQFTGTRKFMGREVKVPFEMLEVNPNSSFTMQSKGGPIEMRVKISFEPVGEATRLTTNMNAEVGGFFKVAEGMVEKQMKNQVADDYLVLKDMLEKM
jgi:carbon monoxide dehydrogenase subunit G